MSRNAGYGAVAGGLLAAMGIPPAHAQPPEAVLTEPLVVTATRIERPRFDLPYSIDVLDATHLHGLQPRVNLSESLARVPGVVAQNRQNYAQDLQISSRGFGARASFGVRGLRLLVDGIPATLPDGQGQAATFDLGLAQRIEILRGPVSAIHGNAAGGVIQQISIDPPATPTVEVSLLAGSHGTRRVGVTGGATAGRVGAVGALARFDSDGYRQHSGVTRDTASARVRWEANADTRVALSVQRLHQPDTQDPLGLTRAAMQQDPRQAGAGALSFNTRKRIDHAQWGVVVERRLDPEHRVAVTGYGGQRDVRQYLAFAGSGPTQAGGVVDLDRGFHGLGLRWTREARSASQPFTVTAGLEYDNMAEHRRGFVNNNGVAGDLKRDQDDRVYNLDHYLHLEWDATPRWQWSGSLRHSRVSFDSRDRFITGSQNPDDSGAAVYERTTPMLGVRYRVRDALNLYANVSHGFETPTLAELAYRPDGNPGLHTALRPSVSRSVETGIKLATPTTRLQAALFRIRVDDEIVPGPAPAPGRSSFLNAPRTARDGVELSVEHRVSPTVLAYLAYTYLDARFVNYVNFSGQRLDGVALPGVPRTTWYGELQWRPGAGWLAALDARRVASIPVDDANTDAAGAYTVVNGRIGVENKEHGWRWQPFVRVDNLFDKAYVGSVIVNASGGAYFEPAPRRTYMIGLTVGTAL